MFRLVEHPFLHLPTAPLILKYYRVSIAFSPHFYSLLGGGIEKM